MSKKDTDTMSGGAESNHTRTSSEQAIDKYLKEISSESDEELENNLRKGSILKNQ